MIEFKAQCFEIEGLEDMDKVNLYLEIPGGVGKAVGQVRAHTEEEDPHKQLVRIEFVFTREWLEMTAGGGDD